MPFGAVGGTLVLLTETAGDRASGETKVKEMSFNEMVDSEIVFCDEVVWLVSSKKGDGESFFTGSPLSLFF